jgi:hypothetical protein
MLLTLAMLAKPAAAESTADLPNLQGAWRITLDTATHAQVPVLGTTTITSRQVMIAKVQRTESGFIVDHDTCGLAAKTRPALADTSFPAAFVDAVPDKRYPLELTRSGSGWAVHMDLGPIAIGFDPGVSASVPQSLSDPAVVDWDHDGKPAATIHLQVPILGTVEVYQAQTARAVLDGMVVSDSEMAGGAQVQELRQRTLGASNRLFVQNPTLQSDPAASRFDMVRVDPTASCRTEPPPELGG